MSAYSIHIFGGNRPENYYERIASRLYLYFRGDADDALFGPLFLYRPRENADACAVISHRMAATRALWLETAPHPPGVSHWVNWWMAAHVPAYAAAAAKPQMHLMDIYRAEIAPEFFQKRAPLFYIDISTIQNEVVSAWGYDNAGPVNSSVEKLLKKGAYLPTSIRYGEGQILKNANAGGQAEQVVRAIALSEMLALYTFDSTVHPFERHVELSAQTTAHLAARLCADKTSRQLYQVICRFLVAATTAFLPLYASASRSPNLLTHIKKTMAGDTINPAKPSYSTEHMWASLCKAIRIRNKIPADIVGALGPAKIQSIAAVMGGTAAAGPVLNAHLMKQVGISARCAELLRQFGPAPFKSPSPKVMRSLVLSLSPGDQATLFVSIMCVANQAKMPQRFFLGSRIARIQREQCSERLGTSTYPVFICQTCFLFRSFVERAEGRNFNPEKSKAGVYATWAGPCCRNCGSSRIACVDLVGHRVKALLRATDTCRRDIMLCSQCVLPTATSVVFGDLPYCSSCYHKNLQLHQGVCMCGLVHSTGSQQTLINPSGELAVYQFCATHRHIRPDSIVKVPIHLIKSRRYVASKYTRRNEARREYLSGSRGGGAQNVRAQLRRRDKHRRSARALKEN